jgi:hypothetical protein
MSCGYGRYAKSHVPKRTFNLCALGHYLEVETVFLAGVSWDRDAVLDLVYT